MSRLIYQCQYPNRLRYQEWHLSQFFMNFSHTYNFNVKVLGHDYIYFNRTKQSEPHMFSPINEAIDFELEQIKDFMNLTINSDDTLYISDCSFPGFFPNVLYHKPVRTFAYCHATSLNNYDYFSNVRTSKSLNELAHSKLFERVFIGSNYHANKLLKNNRKWYGKLEVVGLPIPPFETFKEVKKYDIISVARSSPQKINKRVENLVEKEFGKIYRPISNSWKEYYKNLSMSKILLITGKEDTFNYSIMEAIMNGCIPLAPNRCSYPELLPIEYIYMNDNELIEMIKYYSENYNEVPKLRNWELCVNFFNNINDTMSRYNIEIK